VPTGDWPSTASSRRCNHPRTEVLADSSRPGTRSMTRSCPMNRQAAWSGPSKTPETGSPWSGSCTATLSRARGPGKTSKTAGLDSGQHENPAGNGAPATAGSRGRKRLRSFQLLTGIGLGQQPLLRPRRLSAGCPASAATSSASAARASSTSGSGTAVSWAIKVRLVRSNWLPAGRM
jgi:hypothetical protein